MLEDVNINPKNAIISRDIFCILLYGYCI